jgi:hydroxymethylpyrimidine pyrophosphatase-like HAD family hydrolase
MEIANKVKAVVLDLDGTLLNSQKEVSERSKKAILDRLHLVGQLF